MAELVFFRACHDTEYGPNWRPNLPEVFHFDQAAPTKLTKKWQELIMALNPDLTPDKFRALLRYDVAFTNRTGFELPGYPRADYINKLNLNKKPPFFDKTRICGDAVIYGYLFLGGTRLRVVTLNGRNDPPPLSEVLERKLYFEAVTVRADGTNGRFPQNGGKPIYIPLVASHPVTVRINTIRPRKPYPYLVQCDPIF